MKCGQLKDDESKYRQWQKYDVYNTLDILLDSLSLSFYFLLIYFLNISIILI